jgi:hypothetical protein
VLPVRLIYAYIPQAMAREGKPDGGQGQATRAARASTRGSGWESVPQDTAGEDEAMQVGDAGCAIAEEADPNKDTEEGRATAEEPAFTSDAGTSSAMETPGDEEEEDPPQHSQKGGKKNKKGKKATKHAPAALPAAEENTAKTLGITFLPTRDKTAAATANPPVMSGRHLQPPGDSTDQDLFQAPLIQAPTEVVNASGSAEHQEEKKSRPPEERLQTAIEAARSEIPEIIKEHLGYTDEKGFFLHLKINPNDHAALTYPMVDMCKALSRAGEGVQSNCEMYAAS